MIGKMGWELSWARHPVAFTVYRVGPWPMRWVELTEEGTWTHTVSVRTWGAWRLMLTHREVVGGEFDPWPGDIEPFEFWEER